MKKENQSRTLHLNLIKKWFDMVAANEKLEEYRDFSTYWVRRLVDFSDYPAELPNEEKAVPVDIVFDVAINGHDFQETLEAYHVKLKEFDTVTFSNGYHKGRRQVVLELLGIAYGRGLPQWGAVPGENYFVLQLGRIINSNF